MSRRRNAEALRRYFTSALGPLDRVEHRDILWHSATFTGARHRFAFTVDPAADVSAFACTLPEADIPLVGSFVADALVTAIDSDADGTRVTVEALTIDAA